jgi:hypothetical protein
MAWSKWNFFAQAQIKIGLPRWVKKNLAPKEKANKVSLWGCAHA